MALQVRVLYFASLRESLGLEAESVELPQGADCVSDVLELLRARGDKWGDALECDGQLCVAVDQQFANLATKVAQGCEVAFFPPVTGG